MAYTLKLWSAPEITIHHRVLMRITRQNGVTQVELIETITHIAFYAGWPSAITAIGVAKEVFGAK